MRRTAEKARDKRSGHGTGPGRRKDEKGFVLLIVMILIAALALLGLAASRNMLTDIGIAENQGGNTRAFYAAEAYGEYSYNQLYQHLQQAGTAQVGTITYTNLVPVIQGCPPGLANAQPGTAVQRTIAASSGPLKNFKGLFSWAQTFLITATATDTATNAKSTVSLDVVNTLVPIFQFGIFYQNDLEMNPGANLTIPVNGWIHTNSNLYTSTSATETINSNITTAGQIRHGREAGDPQAVGTGAVSIEGANGTYYNLQDGSQTLSNGNWVNNSSWPSTVSQWGGQVAATEEGVQSLSLPMPSTAKNLPEYANTDEAIIAHQGTMNSLAAVVITNGIATDAAGHTLNTCYANSNHKDSHGHVITDPGCSGGQTRTASPRARSTTTDRGRRPRQQT